MWAECTSVGSQLKQFPAANLSQESQENAGYGQRGETDSVKNLYARRWLHKERPSPSEDELDDPPPDGERDFPVRESREEDDETKAFEDEEEASF
jgi:hypothetical protein